MNRLIKSLIFASFCGVLLTGCAADEEGIPDTPVDELYMTGYTQFKEKDFEESARYFDEIERQHPYSVWAPRAQIMAAYAYYSANKYDDAVLTLERFIQLHPGNRNIAYAYYLKGLSYFEQISDVNREQKMTENALETFKELVYRYPDSIYVADVNEKLKEIESHLAGKEMAIGRYYQKNREYIPAMNRFQNVLTTHAKSNQSPEALYRLTSCYLSLGMIPEAEYMNGFLVQYYPKSFWTEKSREVLNKYRPQLSKSQTKVLKEPIKTPQQQEVSKPTLKQPAQPKEDKSDSWMNWFYNLF